MRPTAGLRSGTLRICVRPGKKKDVLSRQGDEFQADLAAPAREGEANVRLVRNLGTWLSWPSSRIRVEKGKTSRKKTIVVEGLSDSEVRDRILQWLGESLKNP
ncbi:MAG: DUF167 domain-containing protein [Nitrospirae bacterium]|nr:DUF167 domain-containing protein [Nitrospirota bacterium]